jgi:MFS family permease
LSEAADTPLKGTALAITAFALAMGTFMQVLDTTIANVSLPTIAGNLGASTDQSTWIITAFVVANGIGVPVTGWLMNRYGTVKVFVLSILGFTAIAVVIPAGTAALANPGPHGFSEALYAYVSTTGNNGSAFAGLSANTPFWNTTLGLAMFVGRFMMIIPMLAVAGSLAAKKIVPASAGTFPTDGGLFVGLVIGVILIIGGLTFLPSLALGPIAEHLAMTSGTLFSSGN